MNTPNPRLSNITQKHSNVKVRHAARTGRPVHVGRGFSLIELLLVLVILSVLAALIMPRFTNRSEKARITATKSNISTLDTALNAFEIDNGRYPTTAEGLDALMQTPANLNTWQGPYLNKTDFKDPWGNDYIYRSPGQQNTDGYDIYSIGPDGEEGSADDITNW